MADRASATRRPVRRKAVPAARKRPRPGAPREFGGRLDQRVLESLVGYNLRRAEVSMRHHFARALAEWDVRPAEYSALALIASNALVTQADLVDALNVKRPNMVSLIDALERRGLVERTVYARDRRNQILTVTPRGEALVADVEHVVREMDRLVTQCWTARERATVIELLRRFYRQV